MINGVAWTEFISLINSDQDNIKYVPNVINSQSFTDEVVDLANDAGGSIVIGFDKNNYQILGTKFEEKWLTAVINKECTPQVEFTVNHVLRNRKNIFIIDVIEGSEKPYVCHDYTTVPDIEVSKEVITEDSSPSDIESIVDKIIEKEEIFENVDDTESTTSTEFVAEIDTTNFSEREQVCLHYLEEHTEITNSIYRDLNSVSHKTAHNELAHLVKEGVIKQVGQGRTTHYILNSEENSSNDQLDEVTQEEKEESVELNNVDISEKEESANSNIFELDQSIFTSKEPEIGSPSLFGEDIHETLNKDNPKISITEIRKANSNNHMSDHFNNNNIDPVSVEENSLNSEKNTQDSELIQQLADIYEEINN